ncbi:MAG: flagellar motor protein MotB [Elusimicrobiota bacterium]|nr:flagellar motor protein MotB [Elusimicrobiota bacterium]
MAKPTKNDTQGTTPIPQLPEEETKKTIDPSTAWLVPYGNMMTVLLVFFLVLYVFTYQADTTTFERVVTQIQHQFALKGKAKEAVDRKKQEAEATDKIAKYFEETGLDKFAKIVIDAERVRVSMVNPVLFSLGEATLKEEAKMLLKPVAELIRIIPSKVIVEGHTCNLPIFGGKYKSNWELSADRAINVVKYLVHFENIPPNRFRVAGYGEYRPVARNDTEENRAKNRRIEIVILRTS